MKRATGRKKERKSTSNEVPAESQKIQEWKELVNEEEVPQMLGECHGLE